MDVLVRADSASALNALARSIHLPPQGPALQLSQRARLVVCALQEAGEAD
jgi:hypothetical protein